MVSSCDGVFYHHEKAWLTTMCRDEPAPRRRHGLRKKPDMGELIPRASIHTELRKKQESSWQNNLEEWFLLGGVGKMRQEGRRETSRGWKCSILVSMLVAWRYTLVKGSPSCLSKGASSVE